MRLFNMVCFTAAFVFSICIAFFRLHITHAHPANFSRYPIRCRLYQNKGVSRPAILSRHNQRPRPKPLVTVETWVKANPHPESVQRGTPSIHTPRLRDLRHAGHGFCSRSHRDVPHSLPTMGLTHPQSVQLFIPKVWSGSVFEMSPF
jgi:hypothetical protein